MDIPKVRDLPAGVWVESSILDRDDTRRADGTVALNLGWNGSALALRCLLSLSAPVSEE